MAIDAVRRRRALKYAVEDRLKFNDKTRAEIHLYVQMRAEGHAEGLTGRPYPGLRDSWALPDSAKEVITMLVDQVLKHVLDTYRLTRKSDEDREIDKVHVHEYEANRSQEDYDFMDEFIDSLLEDEK